METRYAALELKYEEADRMLEAEQERFVDKAEDANTHERHRMAAEHRKRAGEIEGLRAAINRHMDACRADLESLLAVARSCR